MSIFRPAGKPLPTFTEYLNFLAKRSSDPVLGGLLAVSIMAVALSAVSMTSPAPTGHLFSTVALVLSGIFLVAVATVSTIFWRKRSLRRLDPRFQLHEEAVALARQMLTSKRLHKDLDGSSAQLLEESACFWREIKAELDSPFWRNPELPVHWKTVRLQTSNAADAAMEEMLVLLRSSFHPADHHGWEVMVEDVVETFVTGPKLRKGDRIPPGFAEARQIADKLKMAASQVRTAAAEITAESGTKPLLSSGAALDMAIGDMRSLQEAEQELRRNLNA